MSWSRSARGGQPSGATKSCSWSWLSGSGSVPPRSKAWMCATSPARRSRRPSIAGRSRARGSSASMRTPPSDGTRSCGAGACAPASPSASPRAAASIAAAMCCSDCATASTSERPMASSPNRSRSSRLASSTSRSSIARSNMASSWRAVSLSAAAKSRSRADCSRSANAASSLIQARMGCMSSPSACGASSTPARERNSCAVARSAATSASRR